MSYPTEKLAEWSNVVLAGNFSVSEGHLWAPRAVTAEVDEIATSYRHYHGKHLEKNEWAGALNALPEHITQAGSEPARFDVLGWGSWARLHQRQLCQVIKTTWDWLDDKWGMPEEASAFKKAMTEHFSQLDLLPLVNMDHTPDANSRRAFETRVQTLVEAHPDWVPFSFWSHSMAGSRGPAQRGAPASPSFTKSIWFYPVFPSGTLYDCTWREEIFCVDYRARNSTNLKQSRLTTTRCFTISSREQSRIGLPRMRSPRNSKPWELMTLGRCKSSPTPGRQILIAMKGHSCPFAVLTRVSLFS